MAASSATATVEMTHLQTTRKVFTRWMNHHVRAAGVAVDDCVAALRTGVHLAHLVDSLAGSSLASSKALKRGSLASLDRAARIHNVHLVLMHLGGTSLPLTAIDAEAFVDAKTATVLQFLWTLTLHYEVRPITQLTRIASVAHVCRALLKLVTDALPGYSVIPLASFPHDFKSGLVLAALFHVKDFRSIDFYGLVRRKADRAAVFAAVAPLLEALDCPLFLDPADFDALDDSLFVVFFAPFWKAYQAYEPVDDGDGDTMTSSLRTKLTDAYAKNARLEAELADARSTIAQMNDAMDAEQASAAAAAARKEDQLRLASQDVRQLEMVVLDLQGDLDAAKAMAAETARALEDTLLLERQRTAAANVQVVDAPIGRVHFVYVDIENGLALWEEAPSLMADALLLYHSVVDATVKMQSGYVVRTEGDAVLVAFPSLIAAATFGLVLHLSLLDANWSDGLLAHQHAAVETGLGSAPIFRGLRVAVALHSGKAVRQVDATTGRVDYLGPVVSLVTLLAGAANGGQFLLSDDAFNELEPRLYELRLVPVVTPLGLVAIPGAGRSVAVYSLLPERLAERRFKELRSGPGGGSTADSAVSATERKMMLLADRNTKFTTKLKSLSAEVETASSSARKLVRALSRLQFSTTGEVSAVIREFTDELEDVTATQRALNARLGKTVAENEQLAEHLSSLELAFADEMAAARARIKESQRQMTEIQQRHAETAPAVASFESNISHQVTALEELHEKHKRKARAVEARLRTSLREARGRIKDLEKQIGILEFKATHGVGEDVLKMRPLDEYLGRGFGPPLRRRNASARSRSRSRSTEAGDAAGGIESSGERSPSAARPPMSRVASMRVFPSLPPLKHAASAPRLRRYKSMSPGTSKRGLGSVGSKSASGTSSSSSASRSPGRNPSRRDEDVEALEASPLGKVLRGVVAEARATFADAVAAAPKLSKAEYKALIEAAVRQVLDVAFGGTNAAFPLMIAVDAVIRGLSTMYSAIDMLYALKVVIRELVASHRVAADAAGLVVDIAAKHGVFSEPGWRPQFEVFVAKECRRHASPVPWLSQSADLSRVGRTNDDDGAWKGKEDASLSSSSSSASDTNTDGTDESDGSTSDGSGSLTSVSSW